MIDETEEPMGESDDSVEQSASSSLWELQVVDMTNEDMDMLEWTVRKIIPIPKHYYWEDSAATENISLNELPIKLKVWHRSVAVMGSMVRFVDRLGQPVVNFVGLNNSRFDYVTSTMTQEDWDYSRRTVRERRNLRQQEEMETQKGDNTSSSR